MTSTAPHPTLTRYVESANERQHFVEELFDHTAVNYDRICHIFSLGCGHRYRRDALQRAGLRQGMRVLDVATGTGLVARQALAIIEPGGQVIGVDPSEGMLRESRTVGHYTVRGLGEALPFKPGYFDLVSMGYALRHVAALETAFADFLRVLKPGGRLVILEITPPDSRPARWLTRQYFQHAIPFITRMVTRSTDSELLMKYYWDTIAECVRPTAILDALRTCGFRDASRRVVHGIFSEYTGRKA